MKERMRRRRHCVMMLTKSGPAVVRCCLRPRKFSGQNNAYNKPTKRFGSFFNFFYFGMYKNDNETQRVRIGSLAHGLLVG